MADVVVTNDVDTFLKSANQAAMRTNIGAGTIATQNANNVSITGGSVTGITDLAIADGGTGASTASAARTNLEVYSDAEVDAKVATKATAGGVRLTNKGRIINTNSIWDSSSFTLVWVGGKIDTANSNSEGNLLMIASSGNADIPFTGTGFTNGIQLQTTSTAMKLKIGDGDLSYFQPGLNAAFRTSIVTNQEIAEIVITYDAASNVLKTYLNGTEYAIAQPANSLAVWNSGFTNPRAVIGGDTIATDASVVRYLTCTVNDFKWFNRALSAAEVADLYESGTVAVADRWGDGAEGDTYTSDFSAGNDSWTNLNAVVDGNIDSIGGEDDNLRVYADANNSAHNARPPKNVTSGIKYRIKFDYYIPSGQTYVNAFVFDGRGSQIGVIPSAYDSWQSFSYEWTPTTTGSVSIFLSGPSGLTFIGANSNSDDLIYFRNVTITRLGAIADLPLDEGIGYQFHDRSSNHFDALASTTGVTHLVPKTEGYIRDFGVDAYDGGSGTGVLLVASGRDILPNKSHATLATVYNAGTATVGDLTVNQSNNSGSVQPAIGSYSTSGLYDLTAKSSIDFNFKTREQFRTAGVSTYPNLAITSTDSDATNIDIRVDYKMIIS